MAKFFSMNLYDLENLESCESLKIKNECEKPQEYIQPYTETIEIPFYGNKITININIDKFIKTNYPINIIINI